MTFVLFHVRLPHQVEQVIHELEGQGSIPKYINMYLWARYLLLQNRSNFSLHHTLGPVILHHKHHLLWQEHPSLIHSHQHWRENGPSSDI